MTITWQTIITAGAVLAAVTAVGALVVKVIRWVDKQGKQDTDLTALRIHHDEDIAAIKTEQRVLVHGILACLKGLKEQGCNGPVTAAIEEIEEHLNQKAHE